MRLGSSRGFFLVLVSLSLLGAIALAEQPSRGPREKLVVTPVEPAPKLPVEPELAAEVNGGVIPRAKLHAVLAAGIGRFLQQVKTEPHLVHGRFLGWRLTSLFAGRDDVQVGVLRPGDTVKRANGKSLERPEQFKAIWDSMASATDLVLDVERAGRSSKVRYTIAD